jgi:hypothetical protein
MPANDWRIDTCRRRAISVAHINAITDGGV